MTTLKLTNLVIKSCSNNPYTGKVSKKDNIIFAIELAKLFKEFAIDGYHDEAMNESPEKWDEVLGRLDDMKS